MSQKRQKIAFSLKRIPDIKQHCWSLWTSAQSNKWSKSENRHTFHSSHFIHNIIWLHNCPTNTCWPEALIHMLCSFC